MTWLRGLWNCKIGDLPKYLRPRRGSVPWMLIIVSLVLVVGDTWYSIICGFAGLTIAAICLLIDRRLRYWQRRLAESNEQLRILQRRERWEAQKQNARFN